MALYTIVVVVCSLLAVVAIGVIGYFAYRFGYDKGHAAGYKEAEDQHKQPELSPEQIEAKNHRERFESHIGRLFAYKAPTRK